MIAEGSLINGRYRLDQPIGHGRAGVVWLAFDTQLHRTVCAKPMYIPSGLEPAAAENTRSAVLREGRTACRIVHNCAITVYDTVTDGGNVWQIMEYVPSRTMDQFLDEHGNLTPEQAADLGAQLASALATAHAAGITHGAVSPGNVLLADDGGVKITEFGVSSPEPPAAYRAPERTGTDRAGPAADAFSLGCTLHRAVEGAPPFGTDGTAEQAAPHHAGVLTGVLLKLLHSDPHARPALPDMIAALQAISTEADAAGAVSAASPASQGPTEQQPSYAPPHQEQPLHAAEHVIPQLSAQSAPSAQSHDSGQAPRQQPPQLRPTPRTPASGPQRSQLIVTLAITLAVLVGILFTEIFVL